MKAELFNKGFHKGETWGEAEKLVNKLTVEEAKALYDATAYVREWTGIDMRQEFFQGLLKNRMQGRLV